AARGQVAVRILEPELQATRLLRQRFVSDLEERLIVLWHVDVLRASQLEALRRDGFSNDVGAGGQTDDQDLTVDRGAVAGAVIADIGSVHAVASAAHRRSFGVGRHDPQVTRGQLLFLVHDLGRRFFARIDLDRLAWSFAEPFRRLSLDQRVAANRDIPDLNNA